MSKHIPYGRQYVNDDDIDAVVKALKSDFLTTGPLVKEFEDRLAEYVGSKYAVVMSNGTAALHAACYAAGISEGDEVITTPLTFAASANCILYLGAKPVFVDIDIETYNIDVKQIESKITEKTKAIIPVHFGGISADMDTIHKIAKKYNLLVIEDAAHAIGTEYKGRKIGSLSDMTEFSFHPVKTITSGEGGAITTNSKELYEKVKMFCTHGITRNEELMLEDNGGWYYEQQALGFNYRLTDIQSALGISQLNRISGFISRRNEIVNRYNKAFSNCDGIKLQKDPQYSDTSRHLYIIQLNLELLEISRRECYEKLREKNIGVNVHYIPVYYHPYYKKLGYEKGLCPVAENLYERIITLPLHPSMTNEDVDYVINSVTEIIENRR